MRRLFLLALMAILSVAGWLTWATFSLLQPPDQKSVLLHSGWGTRRIARELKAAGVIRSETAFLIWHRIHPEHQLKAGEYLFTTAANLTRVHDRIAGGDVNIRIVTVPEGYTMFDIADAVEQAGLGSHEEFLKQATEQTALIADLAPQAKSLEGFLFPDTYEFTRSETVPDIVGAMVRRFRKEVATLDLGDALQTVTMASIVEKETGAPDERFLVSSVYHNRLNHKIALQADPTVIYAHLLSGTYSGTLHHSDMAIDSPYNTYRYPGLPPGPIGNPGRAAIEAALHPADSNFFYFVGDGNGHHRFSHNLSEHNQNVAKLRRVVALKNMKDM